MNHRKKPYAVAFPARNDFTKGLSRSFYETFQTFRDIYQTASDFMGMDLHEISYQEAEASPEHHMIALLTHCYALYRVSSEQLYPPLCCFGLSQGEFTAVAAAGGLDFPEVLDLVSTLECLILEDEAVKNGQMMSVVGLERRSLLECCRKIDPGGRLSTIAVQMSEKHNTISGEQKAVEAISKLAKKAGARWTIPFSRGAFHSPVCNGLIKKSDPVFATTAFNDTRFPVISCATGISSQNHQTIKENLSIQICKPVLMDRMVKELQTLGVETVLELGPSCTISGNIRIIDPKINCHWVTDVALFEEVLNTLDRDIQGS